LNGGTKQFAESDKRCERTPGQKVATSVRCGGW